MRSAHAHAHSEDKTHHVGLARRIADATGCAVAVPNYRLTTPASPLQHPAHTEDLLAFLTFLLTWPGPLATGPPYDPARLYLIGHSCSAHMLSSIFLAPPDPAAFPSLVPSPSLIAATRAIMVSEGIYDIDLLLRSFPAYNSWFIADAFGTRSEYAPFNVAAYSLRPGAEHIRWLVLHSRADTLVDPPQSESIYAHLCALLWDQGGLGPPPVDRNWDELDEEHNDMLKGETYPRIIAQFVLDDDKAR